MRVLTNPWLLPWNRVILPLQLPYPSQLASSIPMSFEVRPSGCPNHKKGWTACSPLRDLLFCAGIAQSRSSYPEDLSSWGFLIEHMDSFSLRPGSLRVVGAAASWDSRVKGLFAERLGMGLAAWLLWHHFNVIHIADAGPFIMGALAADSSSPYHNKSLSLLGKYGEIRPDYFCLSRSGEVVIAESKGAIGSPSAVSSAERRKAKKQVQNVNPIGMSVRAIEGRIAFATTIRLESDCSTPSKDTGVHVDDPDGDRDSLPVPLSADEIVLGAYCKIFQFLGLGWITPFLLRGVRPLISRDLELETIRGESVIFLAEIFGLRIGLLDGVLREIFSQERKGLHKRVSLILGNR